MKQAISSVLIVLILSFPIVFAADYDRQYDHFAYDNSSACALNTWGGTDLFVFDNNLTTYGGGQFASTGCELNLTYIIPSRTYNGTNASTYSYLYYDNVWLGKQNRTIVNACLFDASWVRQPELKIRVRADTNWAEKFSYYDCWSYTASNWVNLGGTSCAFGSCTALGMTYDIGVWYAYNSSVTPAVSSMLAKATTIGSFGIILLTGGSIVVSVGGAVAGIVGGGFLIIGAVALIIAAKWLLMDSI